MLQQRCLLSASISFECNCATSRESSARVNGKLCHGRNCVRFYNVFLRGEKRKNSARFDNANNRAGFAIARLSTSFIVHLSYSWTSELLPYPIEWSSFDDWVRIESRGYFLFSLSFRLTERSYEIDGYQADAAVESGARKKKRQKRWENVLDRGEPSISRRGKEKEKKEKNQIRDSMALHLFQFSHGSQVPTNSPRKRTREWEREREKTALIESKHTVHRQWEHRHRSDGAWEKAHCRP